MSEARNAMDRPEARYYFNIEDEVMKLYVLILTCTPSMKDDKGNEHISREYLLEKIGRINQRISISLDPEGKYLFDMMIDDYRPGYFSMNYQELIDFFSHESFLKLRVKNQMHRLTIEELTKLSIDLHQEKEELGD